MPAEPRRASRKLTSEEDIELKRARGEISCAECRRLKLKCDKKLPCGSCVRRGCTTICPNGSLSAGQGTRFILADTDQLHRKISEMSERIRQLEDALAIFQSGVSSERHPLLRDELLSIKFGPEVRRTVDEEATRNKLASSIDALGTLTVGEHGETKFIGRSGGSETLFLTVAPQMFGTNEDSDDLETPSLDDTIENISITFPLTIIEDGADEILRRLEGELPSRPRAWALCEAYLAHFAWWFRPVKRDELINEILSPIYKTVGDPSNQGGYHPKSGCGGRCPHLLAVLYFILAIGALVDLTLPTCSVEAEKYYRLGRASLSLRSILDSPEFETVQAVALMAAYHSTCDSRYSVESAWSLASLACKLSQALGLHRDSARWGLDPKIVDRRRNLFWETFIFEAVHCMSLGRPPAASRLHVDCELPADDEQSLDKDGDSLEGFWHWKLGFTQSIIVHAHDILLNAEPPDYEMILNLDRKIRELSVPKVKLYPKPTDEEYNDAGLCMQSCLMSQLRSVAMLAIHRTFFAQALLDHPTNPLRSPYAPSFLAANRCASVLIKSFLHHCERFPSLCGRFWNLWTHAFTACVILGSTVSRCPGATMAPSSLIELDLAVDLFRKGAEHSKRARQALPMLIFLRKKASGAYQQFRNRHISPTLDVHLHIGPEDEGSNRLAIFGGQTRVMASKLLGKKPAKVKKPRAESGQTRQDSQDGTNKDSPSAEDPHERYSSSPEQASSPASEGSIPQNVQDAFAEVHPALMDYLSLFPSDIALVDPSKPLINPPIAMSPPATASPVPSAFSYAQSQPSTTPTGPSTPAFHSMPGGTYNSFSSPSSQGYSVNTSSPEVDMQTFDHAITAQEYAILGDGMMDPAAWFATLGGMGSNNFGASFVGPLGGEQAMMDDQWMSLMRDTGLLDQNGLAGYANAGVGGKQQQHQAQQHQQQQQSYPGVPVAHGMNMMY
ncbi:fungal-specific transcription factor domain-containing protein [Cristinia sonorae]|uniref:Fungal-specific transcription factor domain-containing protein n=1 Tax=Cristinia sonorae TaxID=1940300 RepID=A0A8K0XSL6_9AGAR|nr:fungal-specific transcription factor domain-containing protein [Cristinia sonorae]